MNHAIAIRPQVAARFRPREAVARPPAPTAPLPDRFNRYLLNVEFEGPGGERRSSLGGGETVREAIEAAREALPLGVRWDVAGWNHLYGE
jgi:hypothetical protein